eukprot:3667676-Rhodomonas_salina.1
MRREEGCGRERERRRIRREERRGKSVVCVKREEGRARAKVRPDASRYRRKPSLCQYRTSCSECVGRIGWYAYRACGCHTWAIQRMKAAFPLFAAPHAPALQCPGSCCGLKLTGVRWRAPGASLAQTRWPRPAA